jgi:putative intracellular protease/amidase
LPEVAHPYRALVEKGISVDIASVRGGAAPMDEKSFDLRDAGNKAFWEDLGARKKIEHTLAIDEVDPKKYAGIFFAGGHGVMWDFAESRGIQRVTRAIWEQGGVVAAANFSSRGTTLRRSAMTKKLRRA